MGIFYFLGSVINKITNNINYYKLSTVPNPKVLTLNLGS